MKALTNSPVLSMVLLLAVIIAGYLGFRYFYGISADYPFSQELLLVFIGAVATVLITALLLNQQTELELKKEGQVLLLDQKNAIYSSLIEHIGDIVEKGAMSEAQLAELRVLNHKLAMIGGADVITQFREVLAQLDQAVRDQVIAPREQGQIMAAVAVLTWHMRHDLLGRINDAQSERILHDIIANNADLALEDDAGR